MTSNLKKVADPVEFTIEVEAVTSTKLVLNDEVASTVNIFTEPALTYDDEEIIDILVPWDAILGYEPVLKIDV